VLKLQLPLTTEGFDNEKEQFLPPTFFELKLEHSLVSLSKWESFFEKPFYGKTEKTAEEILWYVNAIVLTENPPEGILEKLTHEQIEEINAYIHAKMTATTFPNAKKSGSQQTITAELIYYWMVALNIPFECQHWHLNRLLTLVEVCNVHNSPPKKMGPAEAARARRELNEQRRAQYNTRG
jgi:hypothetical protein